MTIYSERHINLFTDFAFGRVFGNESNKELLLDFLNSLPLNQGKIVSFSYLTNDETITDNQTIIGALCQNETGEKFIVQLQKLKQNFFKERSIYYNTLPISNQASKKNWDFELKAVYSVALLDFVFDNEHNKNQYVQEIKLVDIDNQQVFYDKLSLFYLQIPKFNKTPEQLNNRFDKWLYVFKNFALIENLPEVLNDTIFVKFFEQLDTQKLTADEIKKYEESLKYYRDLKNTLSTAKAEGREEGKNVGIELGKQEEKLRVARQLLKMGADIDMISEITDLKHSEIQALSKE